MWLQLYLFTNAYNYHYSAKLRINSEMAKELTYFLNLLGKMTSTLAGRCHAINLIFKPYENSFDSIDINDGVAVTDQAKLGFKFLDSLFLFLDGLGLLEVLLTQNRIFAGHSVVLLNQVAVSLFQIVVSHNDILEVSEKSLVEQLDGWG